MSAEAIRKATGGVLVRGEREFEITGVSTDTRTITPGDLFVALSGDKFDGHDYIHAALKAGACGALYSKDFEIAPDENQKMLIKVGDTLTALGEMARAYRRTLGATVIGITGSNGKTTTKEMTRHLLGGRLQAVASPASFNNFIGLPLTLFKTDAATKVVVLEMGTNHPGEIARLAEIAQPDIGVITNVGRTHLEGLGSLEGVAAAKGELLHALSRDGVAILNADDPSLMKMRSLVSCKVFTFGIEAKADVFASRIERDDSGLSFYVNDSVRVRLNVRGTHNVYNALAAISICRRLGLDLAHLAARFADFKLPPMRLEERKVRSATVINDAYNANPESMARAIEEFARRKAKRKFFIFADMLELGESAVDLHAELGRKAALANFDFYWALGCKSRYALEAVSKSGVPSARVRHFETIDDLGRELNTALSEGDAALIKGSRAMGLERILELLG